MKSLKIDEELVRRLEEVAEHRGESLEQVADVALRRGLEALDAPQPTTAPYHTRPRSMGLPQGVDLTKLGQLADELEDEERARKLK